MTNNVLNISGTLRLVDGPSDFSGRVEVFHDGQFGTVCDSTWGLYEADVVCRQLGWRMGYAVTDAYFGPGTGPIWLSDIQCQGMEEDLLECSHADWNMNLCTHENDAGVVCGNCD